LAAALALLGVARSQAQLQPEVTLKDTFDVSGFTFNLDQELASRQTGTAATAGYSWSGGAAEDYQLGVEDAPGALRLQSTGYTAVSPNHNFVEGSSFTITFDLDAGVNDPDGLSDDWTAVIFGATSQNAFVNGSNGMGILFRNNGNIEVWDGGTRVSGGDGGIAGGLPKGVNTVRLECEVDNFRGAPATIRMFVNDQQVNIGASTAEHVKAAGFRGNFVSFGNYASAGNLWVSSIDNLTVTTTPCIQLSTTGVGAYRTGVSEEISVTIPAQMVANGPATLNVLSSNPDVAIPRHATVENILTLTFSGPADLTKTFRAEGVRQGNATFFVDNDAGACVSGDVAVVVQNGPGMAEVVFEDSFNTSFISWDINVERETRQKGTAGLLNYLEGAASAPGGLADDFTQLGFWEGKLTIINQGNGVSPAHNFIEGSEFTIEFEVEPGVSNPTRDSDNWAAIVFGSPTPNRFVNSGTGMGILFRNDGRIEVWDGASRVYGSALADALPAGPLQVMIDVSAANFAGSPATIAMFVNGEQVRLAPNSMNYVKNSGMLGNYITLAGIGEFMEHNFDNLKVVSMACVAVSLDKATITPGETSAMATVKVPEALVAGKSAVVRLVSSNPSVATLAGAVDGVVTLTFAQGGPLSQSVAVTKVGTGVASFSVETDELVCLGSPAMLSVVSALVRNPSFEANAAGAYPGYGAIADWNGPSGLNNSNGPFHDNSQIPDRAQIAFVQGSGTLSQQITGLEPNKDYWLQFRYNVRNCCGGTMDLAVRFAGADLLNVAGIQPSLASPYQSANVVFRPVDSSGLLEFTTAAAGDATLLLDGVTLVQRDEGNVVLRNPSFEASGTPPWPGYINPNRISGWTGTGGFGVNFTGAGPFADNGSAPNQDLVAFIQGAATLSQNVSGLVPGEFYSVSYAYNARSGNNPRLRVTFGDVVLVEEDVAPVGGSAPYHSKSVTFQAAGGSGALTFAQIAEGDQTVLIDNVAITGASSTLPCIKVTPTRQDLSVGQVNNLVTITIPAELTAARAAEITVTALDPGVAQPVGAVNNVLKITFEVGGPLAKAFDIAVLARGTGRLALSNPHGVCFEGDVVVVNASGSFIKNPSFEANPAGGFPGYGAIDSWTGGSGLNRAAGPFHDNGLIPDRAQVGFSQGSRILSQTLAGLANGKRYVLGFSYNVRNCCGGTIDVATRFGGVELGRIDFIQIVGAGNPYHYQEYAFTASGTQGLLEFETFAAGDATLVIDAVTLTQVDENQVPVRNASFEASGNPAWPGYIQPARVFGWNATGSYGVNIGGVGPFADNGGVVDQDTVAFLQGANSSLSQSIGGLVPGSNYTLTYAYNARGGNSPQLRVTIGGQVAQDEVVTPAGAGAYPVRQFVFSADAETMDLVFTQTAAGDNTVLLDNVRIVPGGQAPAPGLTILRGDGASVQVSWPAPAEGFILQTSANVTGPWIDSTAPVIIDAGRNTVSETAAGAKFFRLKK